MPKAVDFEAALQGGLGAQLGGLAGQSGWMSGLLGGGLGGASVLSGINASNGKPMETYGITLEKVKEMVKNMPQPIGRDLRIAAYEPIKYGAYATAESLNPAMMPINHVEVTIPSNVVYMISANNVYGFSNVAMPITTSGTTTVSYPVDYYPQMTLPASFGNYDYAVPQSAFDYQNYLNGIIQGQLGIHSLYGIAQQAVEQTPAQREAWVKVEAERAAKKSAAQKRAENLLFTILKSEQVRQYEKDGYFETEIDDRIYRIHNRAHSANVELIVKGKAVAKYCAHPKNCYETPIVDTMISQLLMLQSDEAKFLKTANKTVLYG